MQKWHRQGKMFNRLSNFYCKMLAEVGGGASKDGKQIANTENAFIAADDIEYALGNKIPLWLFGFLY